jgi:nitrous oxide reductase accessory protein NosL
MRMRLRTPIITLVLILLILSTAFAADIRCAECGMRVDVASKFSARTTQGDTMLFFCDIGDLFAYLKKHNVNDARIEVKDFAGGAWLDARKAFYVRAEQKFSTPMGWGIAAFISRDDAAKFGSAMDFDAAAKALK